MTWTSLLEEINSLALEPRICKVLSTTFYFSSLPITSLWPKASTESIAVIIT